jgi:hypothetical protein
MSKSTCPLKLPTSVKTAAARLAKADGVSLNQFIAAAVAEKVGVIETAREFMDRHLTTSHRSRSADRDPPFPLFSPYACIGAGRSSNSIAFSIKTSVARLSVTSADHRELNHQGLRNRLVDGVARTQGSIRRRPRLGGLLNYYERAA